MPSIFLTIKLAIRGLLVNKGRTLLTMLGIIIGIASVIIIISVGAGAQSLITNSIRSIGTNLVGVLPGKGGDSGPPAAVLGIVITTLTLDDAKAIEKLPGVEGVSAYSRGFGEMTAGNVQTEGTFSGITASYPSVENHEVALGRFFDVQEEQSAARVAVLGDELFRELFPNTSNPLGEKIKIKNEAFTVIGVLAKKGQAGFSNPDQQVLVPITAAQKLLLGIRHLGLMRIKIDRAENIAPAMEQIRSTLRFRHDIKRPEDDDFTVTSLEQALAIFTVVTDALKLFLACIAAISLLVGGIGVMNIMLMTVKERTREIGLRKAIGATPRQIQNQFVIESMVLTGIGGLIGMSIGSLVAYLVAIVAKNLEYNWDFLISADSIVVSLSVSLIVGILFGFYPARKASRLNPIEALRYE